MAIEDPTAFPHIGPESIQAGQTAMIPTAIIGGGSNRGDDETRKSILCSTYRYKRGQRRVILEHARVSTLLKSTTTTAPSWDTLFESVPVPRSQDRTEYKVDLDIINAEVRVTFVLASTGATIAQIPTAGSPTTRNQQTLTFNGGNAIPNPLTDDVNVRVEFQSTDGNPGGVYGIKIIEEPTP